MKYSLIALLVLLAPAPATAQEWLVARESFAFAGSRLTIHVDAEAPGTLRVIRGGYGAVRVASRTDHGFSAAGLAGSDELTLTSAGPGAIDYLVFVPEDVWVRVRLPGTPLGESLARRTRSRTFQWSHPGEPYRQPAAELIPPLDQGATDDGGLYTTFARDHAPPLVALPDLENARSITVRIQEGPFRVMTSRPLSTRDGAETRLEIRPAAPMDIVLVVPHETPRFRLEAEGETALLLNGDSITPLCSPVTQQWLSNGRRWLTFNPVDGTLRCTAHTNPRHEG